MSLDRRRFLGLLGGVASGLFAFGGYAFGYEPFYRLDVARYQFTPPGWPPSLRLRIAALSDIHASDPFMTAERIRQIVARTNSLEPDIIVLLGDYVFGHSYQFRRLANAEWAVELARLQAPLGVHAILGNHDWWDTPKDPRRGADAVRQALSSASIPVLENDAIRLSKDGQPFWLLGLGDQLALSFNDGWNWRGVDDLPATLAKLSDDAPAILLAHEPDIFVKVPARVSLTLSGHTHGGQLRLFGWSPVIPSRYGNRFAYGHVVENERHLVVTGGLGVSRIPLRFGVPPEIALVTLGGTAAS